MRSAYFAIGWCCFGLGAVGAVVPGLPTVPLMLVALWAFSKSSRRFHDWLYTHPHFGPPLQRWQEQGVVPVRAKILAVGTMIVSLVYLLTLSTMAPWLKAGIVLVMLYGAVYILTRPSRISE